MNTPNNKTSQDLFDHLNQKNVNYDQAAIETYLNNSSPENSSSFLVKILSAIGVVFAASFILLTLFQTGILELKNFNKPSPSFLICGGLFLGLGFALSKTRNQNKNTHHLSEQIMLGSLAVGKLLLCFWVSQFPPRGEDFIWNLAGTMSALTILTYMTINNAIDRFVSSLLSFIFLHLAFSFSTPLFAGQTYLFAPFYAALLATAIWLLLDERQTYTTQPLGYAALIFTCIYIPFSSHLGFSTLTSLTHAFSPFISISLATGLLVTTYYITKQESFFRMDLTLITILVCLTLAYCGAQSLLATLIVMCLGFYKFNRTLFVLGAASFIGFLIQYYYQLNITLLEKSGLLLICGLLILATWAYLHIYIPTQPSKEA